jgi:hypothetical protein
VFPNSGSGLVPALNFFFIHFYSEMDSILTWIVILAVYGADTIAIDLSFSALIS